MSSAPTDLQGRVMSPATAALVVDLVRRLEAAYEELDEAQALVSAIREQRNIVLTQLHEASKRIARQDARIAALADEHRRLLEQLRAWREVAA